MVIVYFASVRVATVKGLPLMSFFRLLVLLAVLVVDADVLVAEVFVSSVVLLTDDDVLFEDVCFPSLVLAASEVDV